MMFAKYVAHDWCAANAGFLLRLPSWREPVSWIWSYHMKLPFWVIG